MKRCEPAVAEGVLKLLAIDRVVTAAHPDLSISPEELRRAAYELQREGHYIVIRGDQIVVPRHPPQLTLSPLDRRSDA